MWLLKRYWIYLPIFVTFIISANAQKFKDKGMKIHFCLGDFSSLSQFEGLGKISMFQFQSESFVDKLQSFKDDVKLT